MKKDFTLTQEDFDALLGWLSGDREEAGRQYERIRDGLIRFFRFRWCADPHALADETINRVAVKVSGFDSSKGVKTITYFYGFATNIYMEYRAKLKNRELSLDEKIPLPAKKVEDFVEVQKDECDCLETCLAKLPVEESRLVVGYYSKEKSEKSEMRKNLAEALRVKPNALYARVHRIKSSLKDCIENCLSEN